MRIADSAPHDVAEIVGLRALDRDAGPGLEPTFDEQARLVGIAAHGMRPPAVDGGW